MANTLKPRNGTLGVVSAVNGLVIAMPAGMAAGNIVRRLTTPENATVVSISRTKELLHGDVSPADMTDVTAEKGDSKYLAESIAASIDTSAIDVSDIGTPTSVLQEPKLPKGSAAKRAANARKKATEEAHLEDLVGSAPTDNGEVI